MEDAGELPPGVYFNPGPEECVRDYLEPWMESEGEERERDRDGVAVEEDIYQHSPDALARARPPGHARGFECRWYFLTHCARSGGRGRRTVATGGYWKVEQKTKDVEASGDGGAGGKRRTYGFYVGRGKDDRGKKTPWLMEEFAVEEEGGGDDGKGERAVPVLCKVYVSPRASVDEKRDIFGEDGVPVDCDGNPKPARVVLSEHYFDAVAERLQPGAVLGHQHYQAAAPPPPPPGVLGDQPDVLGDHHGQAMLPPGVLAHQHGQDVHHPGVLGYEHGQDVHLPGVLGYEHGQEVHLPGVLGYHHGEAVLLQGGLDQYYGMAAEQHPPEFLDPYHIHQGFPGVPGPYNGEEAAIYHQPAPPGLLGPQQDEEEIHTEKKPRLSYGSPAPPPEGMESTITTCEFESQEPEPAPTSSLPEGSSGTVTTESPPPSDDALAPLPPELGFDAYQEAGEPLPGGPVDSTDSTQLSFGDESVGMPFGFEIPFDDLPPPLPDFDVFSVEDFAFDLTAAPSPRNGAVPGLTY
ncbi:hypothetical protein ACP70R_020523 [Stipagrostis hirtigluma subsp. patula]